VIAGTDTAEITHRVRRCCAHRKGWPGPFPGFRRRLGNLGEGYREHGLLNDALSCHQQALLTVRETDNSRRRAIALENLGETYRMLGKLGDAIDCYQQAMTHRRQAGDRHGEAATLECLADGCGSVEVS
jgi:tetratricopeptide (TPR) repeat protein